MLKNITALVVALLLLAPSLASAQVSTPTSPVGPPLSLASYTLTSTSAIACTTLAYVPTSKRLVLISITNTGPTTSIFPEFFDDTKCSVQANVKYGDGATVTIGQGQVITLNFPLNTGLSYTLSGALGSTQNLIILTEGIGF